MIILLNGAFGVGKTTTAEALVKRLPDSLLYDPEEVGVMIQKVTEGIRSGPEDTEDFQDIALWRALTVEVARRLQETYGRTLVVPMTFARPDYFREVRQGLEAFGADVRHFCLTAALETIHARLDDRGVRPNSWAHQQTARCLEAYQSDEFENFIDTENKSPEEILHHLCPGGEGDCDHTSASS